MAMTDDFVALPATLGEAGKPGDQTLVQAILQDIRHLKEMMGSGDLAAGAAADHNHDGVNSARVEVGPNYIRNGSFESSSAGWSLVPAGSGSVSIGASVQHDGANALIIDCATINEIAGTATTTEFIPVTGGQTRQFVVSFKGSAESIAIKVEVIWYTFEQAEGGSNVLLNGFAKSGVGEDGRRTLVRRVAAPAGARYAKLKITGGGTTTATGSLYIDGVYHTLPALMGGARTYSTAGSHTFSDVWGDVEVELCGGGGGGGNDSTGGSTGWGLSGGTTTFSTISATGGEGYGRPDVGGSDGTGGVGTGGSVNKNGLTGAQMPYPWQNAGVNEGGRSYMRGAGSTTREAGDGGYGLEGLGGVGTGGGGGAGGYAYSLITTSGDVAVTVGAGGNPGSGAQGQAGMAGVVKVKW